MGGAHKNCVPLSTMKADFVAASEMECETDLVFASSFARSA